MSGHGSFNHITFFENMRASMGKYHRSLDKYMHNYHASCLDQGKNFDWDARFHWMSITDGDRKESNECILSGASNPPSPPTKGHDQYMTMENGEPVVFQSVPSGFVLDDHEHIVEDRKSSSHACLSSKEVESNENNLAGNMTDSVHSAENVMNSRPLGLLRNTINVIMTSTGFQKIEHESDENISRVASFFSYIFCCFFRSCNKKSESLLRMVYVDGLIKSILDIQEKFKHLKNLQEKIKKNQLRMIYCQFVMESPFATHDIILEHSQMYNATMKELGWLNKQYLFISKNLDVQMNNLSCHTETVKSEISFSFRGRLKSLLAQTNELTKSWAKHQSFYAYSYDHSYSIIKDTYKNILKLKLFLDTKVIDDIERYMKNNLSSFSEIGFSSENQIFSNWHDLCLSMDNPSDKKENKAAFQFFYNLMNESHIYIPGGPLSSEDKLSSEQVSSMYQPNWIIGRPVDDLLNTLNDRTLKPDTYAILLDELTKTICAYKNLNKLSSSSTTNAFRFLLAKILKNLLKSTSLAIESLFHKNYNSIGELNESGTTLLQRESINRIKQPLANIREISWLQDDPLLGFYDVCVEMFQKYYAICEDVNRRGYSERSICWRVERRYSDDLSGIDVDLKSCESFKSC